MQQAFDKFLMFRNRLEKQYRHLGKQARRQEITCYRIYDHDIPEFPFIIEFYEGRLYVSEYKRRHGLAEEVHEEWLGQCKRVMAEVLGIAIDQIFLRVRQRKEGRLGQYQKLEEERQEFVVKENGLSFIVNLSDYLDTGLFLDHRITRQIVREMAGTRKVLNLFSYTGSFSVYAVAGQAADVTSVDLSRTYLNWSERNMKLNFPQFTSHRLIHADVKQYLKEQDKGGYDLAIMDPPTFSNSKRMEDFLDIQKDHVGLINDCIRSLNTGGVLIFSTNYTKFKLDEQRIQANEIMDITRQTTPFDFKDKLKRQCFRISK